MQLRVLVLAVIVGAVGCAQKAALSPATKGTDHMGDIKQEIPLSGFDPKGEPIIRVMADDSVYVVFNFMPPVLRFR